jgi:hypothetical protein
VKLFARIEDDGQRGAKVSVFTDRAPAGCPGMGGWKRQGASWWTRVKGQAATRLLQRRRPRSEYMGLTMDGDRITAVAIGDEDDMDDDLAEKDRAAWPGLRWMDFNDA